MSDIKKPRSNLQNINSRIQWYIRTLKAAKSMRKSLRIDNLVSDQTCSRMYYMEQHIDKAIDSLVNLDIARSKKDLEAKKARDKKFNKALAAYKKENSAKNKKRD